MEENFADHPVSLGEHRANVSEDGRLWTPRDMLIALLREIDRGELAEIDGLVITIGYRHEDGLRSVGYRSQGLNRDEMIGVLERNKALLLGLTD